MNYAEDILKHESYYYTLSRATITDGVLNLRARGYATCTINSSNIARLTNTFQFNCIASTYSDRYEPDIEVRISVRSLETGDKYNVKLYPVDLGDNLYSCIFELHEGEYTDFTFTIYSSMPCEMTLWELCPEALSEDIEVIIDGVKQSLPRLLYDYNTYGFTADVYEATVGLITCRLLDATDIQGHFVATFTASDACTVVVRFYDNNSEELFSPLYYDVSVGKNTIGIPHSFLERKAGLHTFVVSMQAFAGTLSFETRNILFTIDGGYLAARELNIGINVLDMAIKQLAYDLGPNELWLVGLDKGELQVRKRDYNDPNSNVSFTPVGSMGKALYGAIEFNGDWVYRRGTGKYTIETEEDPYIFVVDENNNLYAYHGVFDEEPYLIDSGVTMAKACRGYSSIIYPEQDQGLVVAYIRTDGAVWYCQHCYDAPSQTYFWHTPVELDAGPWDFVTVTRLNDYRLSFQLSNRDYNIWKYTDRTFVAQSVAPEELDVSINRLEYDLYYGSSITVTVDEITYTYEHVQDYYLWYVTCHIDYPIIVRIGDNDDIDTELDEYIASNITVTGDLASNVFNKQFDIDSNCMLITLKMSNPPTRVPLVSCTISLNSPNGKIVALVNGFYYNFNVVSGYFEVDGRTFITVDYPETFLLNNVMSGYLQYRATAHIIQDVYEVMPLSNMTYDQISTLRYNRTRKVTLNFNNELFTASPIISCTLSYTGTHVKPI